MKNILWILILPLLILSCQKVDNSELVGSAASVNKSNLVLSEVWVNGSLDEKYDYENGKLVRFSFSGTYYTTTFQYPSEYIVLQNGYFTTSSIYWYDESHRLQQAIHSYGSNPNYKLRYDLTWDMERLTSYSSLRGDFVKGEYEGYIKYFYYPGDWAFESKNYWVSYRDGILMSKYLVEHRVFKWQNPFLLREIIDGNKFIESRFSTTIRKPNYNIVNFPMLYNRFENGNKHDLMNRVEVSLQYAEKQVSSGMLKLEEREVQNGTVRIIKRVENLVTNKDKLPISYDLKDMASGTITHYEFKYVTL